MVNVFLAGLSHFLDTIRVNFLIPSLFFKHKFIFPVQEAKIACEQPICAKRCPSAAEWNRAKFMTQICSVSSCMDTATNKLPPVKITMTEFATWCGAVNPLLVGSSLRIPPSKGHSVAQASGANSVAVSRGVAMSRSTPPLHHHRQQSLQRPTCPDNNLPPFGRPPQLHVRLLDPSHQRLVDRVWLENGLIYPPKNIIPEHSIVFHFAFEEDCVDEDFEKGPKLPSPFFLCE